MAENFDLIFGSSASQSYSWNDSDYQNGWQTVGDTPPTREQFDALQRRADLKAQELNNRLAPIETKAKADGRQAGTAYTVGAAVTVDGLPADWLLVCTTAGTSGTAAITLPNPLIDGATITDGTITWKLRKVATNGGLGFRQPSTAYTVGAIAYHASLPTGYYLECTTAGTTSAGDITPSSTIGATVSDGTVVWTVGRKVTNAPNVIADCDSVMEGSIKQFDSTTSNIPAVGADGNLVTVGLASSKAQIAVTSDNKVYYRSYASSAWGTWQRLTTASEIVDSMSMGTNGYVKFGNLLGGLTVQWGYVSDIATNTTSQKVPMPIAFSSVAYAAFVSSHGWNASYAKYFAIARNDANNFTVYPNSAWSLATEENNFMWFAIGY